MQRQRPLGARPSWPLRLGNTPERPGWPRSQWALRKDDLTSQTQTRSRSDAMAAFGRGYLALLPLWSGAIPAGIAYGVAARAAGLSVPETQVMSLVVFSAAGQIGAVSLLAGGASPLVL